MIDTKKLTVSASPHLKSADTTTGIMRDVIIALVPAGIAAVLVFGLRALAVIVVSVVSCVLAEFLSRKAMKKEDTITDLSAVVTGLLLAYNLPSNIPFWIVVLGAVIAIVVIKQMFGGIGQNFINPAPCSHMAPPAGFEPATLGLEVPCSIQLSYEGGWGHSIPNTPAGAAANAQSRAHLHARR